MITKKFRESPFFMRNSFLTAGKWEFPFLRKQQLDLENIQLIACSDTRPRDNKANRQKGVHFFVDDYRFTGIYNHPRKSLRKYGQYAFLLTPDFSTYADMHLWRQMESVAQNRWVGAYWQSEGLTVIPTISWSTARSYEFCFDAVEKGSIVAVSTVGCRRAKRPFLRGYQEMLSRIEPEAVICFGAPFQEMEGNIITVDYWKSRKAVR